MEPGDIFVMNDPFDGGMHTPDIFVVKPVFHGENDALVGYAVTVAHHGDVGGRLPGSSACDNTEVFQEGLRLPWMHLYRRDEPVDDLVRIIRANVRIPRMTMGDINAQIAACNIAERALQELAGDYGSARLTGLMEQLVDRTERIVRAEIAGWPDGTASFVDYIGSDGIDVRDVKIAVDVTISGDEVTVDFSGSDPMVAGALNSTRSFTEATVYQAVMSAVSVDIPTSSGAFRPVNVVTKPGTVTHVVMPGASTMRGVTGFRMFDAVNGALAQLVPDRVAAAGEGGNTLAIFAGTRPDGERLHLLRARRRHMGGATGDRRQRWPLEPVRDRREHPCRGRRGRVPDHDRALRARAGQRRRGTVSRRARDRAGLAHGSAEHVAAGPLGPPGAPTVRPRGRRAGGHLREHAAQRQRRQPSLSADVLDRAGARDDGRPPDGRRRRMGRSARP